MSDLSEARGLIRVGWGVVYCVFCAPKSWSAERVADEATSKDPPGTIANRWVVAEPRERSDIWNGINQVPCPESSERIHWLVNC